MILEQLRQLDVLGLLLWVSSLGQPQVPQDVRWTQRGIASTYYNGKDGRHWGGGLACLWGHPKGQHVDRRLRFVAHRWLPCGTIVLVHLPKTGRSVLAVTVDRGPYGAMHEGRWVLKIRRSDPGRWRGVLDMSPGTAEALGATGWDRVRVKRLALEDVPALLGTKEETP